jgi:hypothetical protein
MTQLLEQAFSEVAKLPESEQNVLARWLLLELASEKRRKKGPDRKSSSTSRKSSLSTKIQKFQPMKMSVPPVKMVVQPVEMENLQVV